MKRVCAWCERDLEEAEGNDANEAITHGMCDSCHRIFVLEMRLKYTSEQSAGKKSIEINASLYHTTRRRHRSRSQPNSNV